MAKTIEQLQAFIDTNPDIRQLVNEITDYLQANPSGNGGSGTLQDALDNGSVLDKDNAIDAGGFNFEVENANEIDLIALDYGQILVGDETLNTKATLIYAEANTAQLFAQEDDTTITGEVTVASNYIHIYARSGNDRLYIDVDTLNGATINRNAGTPKKIATVNVADNFANDGAAAAGGIIVGECYHTAGTVKIRLV